jgi:hypothetical protein
MKQEIIKYSLIAVAAVVVFYVVKNKAGDALNSINPANNDNVINKGFSAAYGALTGSSSGSIGSDAYDWLHDEDGGNVLNPFNSKNIVNRNFETLYKGLTGSDATIGSDAYDVMHDDEGNNILSPLSKGSVVRTVFDSTWDFLNRITK